MNVRTIDLGDCTVRLLSGGRLRLDGGAMFGIIPKALWARSTPADEHNRIQLACNCLFVEWSSGAGRRVVVELGHGNKFGEKERGIYEIDPRDWLIPVLANIGVDPQSVSDVVPTHLHFDHAGGLTAAASEPGGPAAYNFPRARVHVQRREFEDARANFGIMTMTYREENFAAVDAAGAWQLVDGDADIIPAARSGAPRVSVLSTPGHTRGHQSVLVHGKDRALLFVGDVMPTRAHVGPPYNMGYDQYPHDNRDSKRRILALAATYRWLLVLGHEPNTPVVSVTKEKDWFVLTPE